MVLGSKVSRIVTVVLIMGLLLAPAMAFAYGSRHDGRDRDYRGHDWDRSHRHYPGHRVWRPAVTIFENDFSPVVANGVVYYYSQGRYYIYSGDSYAMVLPPVGAVVRTIPVSCQKVVVNGRSYYRENNVFYLVTPYGYEVVPPPVVTTVVQRNYTRNTTKATEGAVLGGVLGAVIGGIVGHQQKGRNDVGGAILGGAAGAITGGVIGSQMSGDPQVRTVVEYQTVPAATPVLMAPAVTSVRRSGTSTLIVNSSGGEPMSRQETGDERWPVNIPNDQGGYTEVLIKRSGVGYVGPQGEYYAEFPKVAQLAVMYGK